MVDYEKRHNRIVRFIHYGPLTRPVEAYIKCWNPVGIISDSVKFRTSNGNRRCPTVFLDVEPESLEKDDVLVQYDSFGAGRLAAEEFIREGLAEFAFIGSFGPRYWSDERQCGFEETCARSGARVDVYGGSRTFDDVFAVQEDIRRWILSLPKPCGVFAANDSVAEYVLGVCQFLGVKVPEEIAVIGVDNDTTICENAFQAISSIEPDFRRSGSLAAEAIDAVVAGRMAGLVSFGSRRFVRRESSHLMKRPDNSVRKALELIRKSACSGISVGDVVEFMNVPRRTAESRFRAASGMSILEAIGSVKLETIKTLLVDRSIPLSEISRTCAFSSEIMFRRFFKKHTGLSPRAWRNENESRDRQ